MVLKILRISEVIGLKVYTDAGDYLGSIEEANLVNNKLESWKIKVARDSSLAEHFSGAKGIIVPHQYVKAFGEVVIISKGVVPEEKEE